MLKQKIVLMTMVEDNMSLLKFSNLTLDKERTPVGVSNSIWTFLKHLVLSITQMSAFKTQ